LEDIYDTVQTQLNSRPFWVLLERQYLDQQSKQKVNPLLFNSQLEMICSTFFNLKGCVVRTIEPSLRYPFLGIHDWKKLKRHARKKQVVQKVQELLTRGPNNAFAGRQHDLSMKPPRGTEVQAAVEKLLTDLQIKHELLQGRLHQATPWVSRIGQARPKGCGVVLVAAAVI
jgi:hypothetical protein